MATIQHARTATEAAGPGRTLADVYNPRSNALDVLRLVFASVVAVTHATAIAFGWQPIIRETEISILAVDAFFVLSGFLIAASWLRLNSLPRFVWHRFLRIMPAFWACLIITAFAVAPLVAHLEGGQAASVFGGDQPAWNYVLHNAALYIVHFDVAGLPAGTAQPGVINGALWTLFYEAVCYGLIAVLGVLGVLRRRPWMLAVIALVCWVMLIGWEAGFVTRGWFFWRFIFMFLLGSLAHLYARRVPVSGWLALAAVPVTVVGALLLDEYRPIGGVAFAYIVIWLTVAVPALHRRLRTDLSYGVYVAHWPVFSVLTLAGLPAFGVAPYLAIGAALVFGIAWLSWHGLEKRALAMKDLGKQPVPAR
ncbi:MAG: acyltransferase [Dermatophilus congolensis]|nr:acyltransferase [Dermatophilus congolensis]